MNSSKAPASKTAASRSGEDITRLLEQQADQLPMPAVHEPLARQTLNRIALERRETGVSGGAARPLLPWLGAGAAAAALLLAVVLVPEQATSPAGARIQIPAPSQLDRPLASGEQSMQGELEHVRADLRQLARLAAIRLESREQ